MNLSKADQETLDEFLASIEPTMAGYQHAGFSYFAVRQGAEFILVQGKLHLQGVPALVSSEPFESKNVKAGFLNLKKWEQTPKSVINKLLTGKLVTPHGELVFPVNQSHSYSVYLNPFHQDGILSQRRQIQFMISGGHKPQFNQTKIDWELRASINPFENIQELCNTYVIGPISQSQEINLEVVVHSITAIDACSIVKESKAYLTVDLVFGLNTEKTSLGFQIWDKNKVLKRGRIAGTDLAWSNVLAFQTGSCVIDVPSGAIVHCFANYAGITHHHFWVTDPSIVQNPRRAVHEAFDEKLEVLNALLKIQGKGRDARDFEIAIAWLLWLLGFNVTHLGATPQTSDALDLIATIPEGHFMVIECTTGLLKAENKLPTLVERTEIVRRSLANSSNGHLKVLPVIVTNKSREEVKADLEQAQKLGILVVMRESFPTLIARTYLVQDPNQLYKLAEDAIRRGQNQAHSEPNNLFELG